MSLFAELKRRNVFRVGAAYIVASWLIIQVVENNTASVSGSEDRLFVSSLSYWLFFLSPRLSLPGHSS